MAKTRLSKEEETLVRLAGWQHCTCTFYSYGQDWCNYWERFTTADEEDFMHDEKIKEKYFGNNQKVSD